MSARCTGQVAASVLAGVPGSWQVTVRERGAPHGGLVLVAKSLGGSHDRGAAVVALQAAGMTVTAEHEWPPSVLSYGGCVIRAVAPARAQVPQGSAA